MISVGFVQHQGKMGSSDYILLYMFFGTLFHLSSVIRKCALASLKYTSPSCFMIHVLKAFCSTQSTSIYSMV